jgi:hypothetical protein
MSRKRNKSVAGALSQADHKLAPEQFHALNRVFYEGFQIRPLELRVATLCAMQSHGADLVSVLGEKATWGKIELATDTTEDELKTAAELEIVSLHHHLCETLFRVFWVHANQEQCPWIGMARLRTADLTAAARTFLDESCWPRKSDGLERQALVTAVLYGVAEYKDDTDPRIIELAPTVLQWIEVAARTVLAAPLYNAWKHGLAIMPSPEFTMTVSNEGLPPLELPSGSGFQFIEAKQTGKPARWQWFRTQEHVDFAARAAEAAILLRVLETILKTGAFARGVSTDATCQLMPHEVTPAFVQTEHDVPYFLTGFSDGLLYYK